MYSGTPIHAVCRPIEPGEPLVCRPLPGDILVGHFFGSEIVPFHVSPLFKGGRNSASYYEGLAFNERGERFPWEPANVA